MNSITSTITKKGTSIGVYFSKTGRIKIQIHFLLYFLINFLSPKFPNRFEHHDRENIHGYVVFLHNINQSPFVQERPLVVLTILVLLVLIDRTFLIPSAQFGYRSVNHEFNKPLAMLNHVISRKNHCCFNFCRRVCIIAWTSVIRSGISTTRHLSPWLACTTINWIESTLHDVYSYP